MKKEEQDKTIKQNKDKIEYITTLYSSHLSKWAEKERMLTEVRDDIKELKQRLPDLKDLQEINNFFKDYRKWSKVNKVIASKISKFVFKLAALVGAIFAIKELIWDKITK